MHTGCMCVDVKYHGSLQCQLASGSAQHVQSQAAVMHTYCDVAVPRINRDRTLCTRMSMPSFTPPHTHTHTLTLFWPFAQSQRGSSFVPQLNSGRNEMVIQRKPHCVWQSPSSQQPQSGGYNMAAGMLIRPWVKALHSGSLPHTEHVTSVFDTTFCRREYTATGQSNTQLLQTLSTHTGKHSGKGWAHGVKNTFSFHNLAKEPS